MVNLSHVHQYLLNYSIKPSMQRTAVMDYLLKNRTHPTVDEIYVALSPNMPTLSKTTVYNTLNLFVDKGAVRLLTLDEKNARYDVDVTSHAHFICRNCGKVADIYEMKPDVLQKPEGVDFDIEKVELSYMGTCGVCKSRRQA